MYLFEPHSLVVLTAAELLAVHQPRPGGDETCAACGAPAPCLTAINAGEVQAAAPPVPAG